MLAVPLFHIHPEADHRHGEAEHVHGGTVHVAWSPDLDGEFDSHPKVDRTEQSALGVGNLVPFSHVGDRHTEVSLSLLNDSTDRKSFKPFFPQALELSPALVSGMEWYARIQRSAAPILPSIPCIHAISSRGPPSFLV
jgi:hypothetical protein